MDKCRYADANITIHEDGETYQTGNEDFFDTENYHKFYEGDNYKIMESMFVDNKVLVGNILYDEQTKYDAISKQVKIPEMFLDMNEIDKNHINPDIDYEIERKLDNKSTHINYNGLTLINVELEDNNLYI